MQEKVCHSMAGFFCLLSLNGRPWLNAKVAEVSRRCRLLLRYLPKPWHRLLLRRDVSATLIPALALSLLTISFSTGCKQGSKSTPPAPPAAVQISEGFLKVERLIPHDKTSYTQGLELFNGVLIESTGQYGQSSIRKIDPATGKVLSSVNLENRFFGEGCTVFNDTIYQLTWKEQTCLTWAADDLTPGKTFTYTGEGWGLTHTDTALIRSDGTATITWHDPRDFSVIKTVPVTYNGNPQAYLNELEWVDGKIYANVYQTDKVVRIRPSDGQIDQLIDCSKLLAHAQQQSSQAEVLNGLAYVQEQNRWFIGGKNWPTLYYGELIEK